MGFRFEKLSFRIVVVFLKNLIFNYVVCVYVCWVCVVGDAHVSTGAQGRQRRAVGSLKLELLAIASCCFM